MLTADVVRTMLDYHYSRQRRVWECIMTLTDEQFMTEIPYSYGSVRNHMVHLASVDSGWLAGLKEEPNARSRRYIVADYSRRDSVRLICDKAAADVMAYAAGLDDAAMQEQPHGMPALVWQVLLHLVNHGTDHRAQVLRALHDFGAPTIEQDLIYYFMES
jgi:uncharacterized damage-inducible protein DinB